MATDKKMNYEMQGGSKPARNYLGKQKTVSHVPLKWKSGPGHPSTELAYITKAEKDLLVKKDLHGSLKNGPNTGPDGIISLNSQGDYTRDRSPAGRQSSPGGPDRSRIAQDKHEAHMRSILTGQKDIGQTSRVSDKVREGAVPEYVNTPDGMKYVGSAYKDSGNRGFISRLLGGANRYGYAPIRGLRSIQTRGTPGQPGFGYYSDDENVGDMKPGYGGRFFGGLMSLLTGIPFVGGAIGSAIDYGKGIFGKNPRDMSEFNRLGLFGIPKGTLDEDDKIPVRADSAWQDGSLLDRWSTPINRNVNFGNTIAPYSGTQAGDFIKNLNDPNNMASGMQISNDQMNSMINLINSQNNNAGIVRTNAFNNSGTGIDNVTNTDEMNMYYGGS